MRTTIDIADDVMSAARAFAKRENITLGQAISHLARTGLTGTAAPAAAETESYFGFRPLPRKPGVVVTDELIDKLREEEGV